MKITEIQITPIKPTNGLVAFASCLIDKNIYLGSIGIFTRLDGGYRLIYPTKKIGGKNINIFHPINKQVGEQLSQEIINKYKEVMNQSNDRHYSNYSRSI